LPDFELDATTSDSPGNVRDDSSKLKKTGLALILSSLGFHFSFGDHFDITIFAIFSAKTNISGHIHIFFRIIRVSLIVYPTALRVFGSILIRAILIRTGVIVC
jgi:hypothetical protein